MLVFRRKSGAFRLWSLRTHLKGDCAIPVSCIPEPESEPELESAPFVEVGLPFFAMDVGNGFPPGDDEPFSDSSPVISADEVAWARFDTGPAYPFWVTDTIVVCIEPVLGNYIRIQ